MKGKKYLTCALALALMLVAVVGLTRAQGPVSGGEAQQFDFAPANQVDDGPQNMVSPPMGPRPAAIEVEPSGLINYQGRMIHNGSPYNGNINITFRLYTVAVGGGAWWQETQNVQVDEGLFNVMLGAVVPLDDEAVSFQNQQWLGIQPAGAANELTPRQPLGVVAYAMNLMPGATMVDTNNGAPYGYSFWVSSSNHPAIYAASDGSRGITGYSTADVGIYGSSTVNTGVLGQTGSDDYDHAGVMGSRTSSSGTGVRGYKAGTTGVGARGINEGDTGSGTSGTSSNYVGTWGETGRGDNNYGLYTPDNLYSLNYHLAGAVMRVVQNGGGETLELGDVAVFSGMSAPLAAGGPPMIQVARATEANSTAVAGVVFSRYNVQMLTGELGMDGEGATAGLEVTIPGPVAPGEYMLLVVQGPAQVKASAVAGAIQPGDLLSSGGTGGHAAQAAAVNIQGVRAALPGTVFGKALEPLGNDQGLIYVYVTLQ
jgi:hypothetical protein